MTRYRTIVVLLLLLLTPGAAARAASLRAPGPAPKGSSAPGSKRAASRPASNRGTKAAADTSRSMLNVGAFTSAEVCGACHKDIHAGWSASLHGRSFTDPM